MAHLGPKLFRVAIHEAGHAIAFLAHGRKIDAIILDGDGKGGRVLPADEPSSIKSEAIITLAGLMAEHVAWEKGELVEPPVPLPSFNKIPLEEKVDDESKYRSNVNALQQHQPGSTRTGIDRSLKHETRDLVEANWEHIMRIAHAFDSVRWRTDAFNQVSKTLTGVDINTILKT